MSESSKESYDSKRALLTMMVMMMMIRDFHCLRDRSINTNKVGENGNGHLPHLIFCCGPMGR
jgi:hypothetical protein